MGIEKTFQNCLMQLTKSELEMIRDRLDMHHVSNMKKQELAIRIEESIRLSLPDILAYIPWVSYSLLVDIVEDEEFFWDDAEEDLPEELTYLMQTGLVFAAYHHLEGFEFSLPLREALLDTMEDPLFCVKREYTRKLEGCISSIFFYWGAAELDKVMAETAGLMNLSVDEDAFIGDFQKIIHFLEPDILKYQLIGHTRYFFLYSINPIEQISSLLWQNSEYPSITADMIPEETGWFGFILHNPYFKQMYDIVLQLIREDDEGPASDVDHPESDEFDQYYHEDALEVISFFAETVMNANPKTPLTELFREIDLPDYIWRGKEIKRMIQDLREHMPNYWFKGNTLTGDIHDIWKSFQRKPFCRELPDALGSKPVNSAAWRWKVGQEDLCPCGSGKKYRNCCSPKQ